MLTNKKAKYEVETTKKYHNFQGTKGIRDWILGMKDPVLVYGDPDVDGMIAMLLVVKYLIKYGKKYAWFVNTNREHGWTLDYERVRGRDIIAVDFIITRQQINNLVDLGCNILSMDHHENEEDLISVQRNGKKGVVVNNQYLDEESDGRYLSGAGVVFEALCGEDPSFDTLENRALVGITLLSDVRDIENPIARGYLKDLYTHKYKGYIRYLIDNTIGEKDYTFGVPRMDRNYVDYKFSPAINSCLRFNREEDVARFFLGSGFLNLEYHKMQKELVAQIQENVRIVDYSKLRVCYFKEEMVDPMYWEVLSSFVGLDASKNLDGKRSVICYMIAYTDTGKPYVKRASFRGNINGLDYRRRLLNTINGVGHGSAFGIKELYPSKELFLKVNKICTEVEVDSNHVTNITEVLNLSFFAMRKGYEYGEYNMYCLTQHRKYIRYVGKNIEKHRSGANYIEYSVDGLPVMCFDISLNFENGLILPINERGNLALYLESGVEDISRYE